MVSTIERFWIKFILRFAIGMLFAFAAIGQFNVGTDVAASPAKFADQLSGGFKSTWIADVQIGSFSGLTFSWWFLYCLPYVLAGLSALILTGIFVRPALRLGAIVLVCLGLGKYMQGPENLTATASDFLFALIICIGLFFYGLEKKPATQPSGATA